MIVILLSLSERRRNWIRRKSATEYFQTVRNFFSDYCDQRLFKTFLYELPDKQRSTQWGTMEWECTGATAMRRVSFPLRC